MADIQFSRFNVGRLPLANQLLSFPGKCDTLFKKISDEAE